MLNLLKNTMKEQSFICIVILFAIVTSCFGQATDKVKEQEYQIKEQFETFFIKFKDDEKFQISRIIFPLEYWESNDDVLQNSNELIKDYIIKEECLFNDFQFNDTDEFIEKKDSIVTVKIRGRDSGIYINYFFKKEKEKWFMYKVENKSN